MVYIYCLFSMFLFLPFLPILVVILRKKGLWDNSVYERFGHLNVDGDVNELYDRIWFHGASVGEIKIVHLITKALQRHRPNLNIFVTTNTTFGRRQAERLIGNIANISYAPFDVYPILKKRLMKVKPKAMVFVETELWPCWIYLSKRMGARLILINGRISDRSFKNYLLIRPLMQHTLKHFDLISVISYKDKERFIALGAKKEKVVVTGNIKLDEVERLESTTNSKICNLKIREKSKVIVAGSIRKGEIGIIIDAYERILEVLPQVDLVIAPRHLENTGKIIEYLEKREITYMLRSNYRQVIKNKGNVIILDTIGELFTVYSIADVVFLGSSMVPLGGQNPVEPAMWEKPIITGPSYEDFSYIFEELIKRNAVTLVRDTKELLKALNELLKDDEKARIMGRRAKEIIEGLRGATERNVELILSYIES